MSNRGDAYNGWRTAMKMKEDMDQLEARLERYGFADQAKGVIQARHLIIHICDELERINQNAKPGATLVAYAGK